MMSEYTGATARACPSSVGVYPSVARTTKSALTVPCSVTTRCGAIDMARGLLIDRHAPRAEHGRKPSHQLRWLDRRAVRRVGPAQQCWSR